MSNDLPRSEYPRPQMVRSQWLCLNGTWDFAFDHADTGLERGMLSQSFDQKITVPFCPESELSGIGHVDFMDAVWYRRSVQIPKQWDGQRLLLHFQAVDNEATVWVNDQQVGRHKGGWSPFNCDITNAVKAGQTANIVVRARDGRSENPRGKQSVRYKNFGCLYTRTTGIWQTVWLEPVPMQAHLNRPRITPDVANNRFMVEQAVTGNMKNLKLRITLADQQGQINQTTCKIGNQLTPIVDVPIPEDRLTRWSIQTPHLYDLTIELLDDQNHCIDHVKSYAGLRSISISGKAVYINDEPVFQRLVLDQGYYADGIMTAPTEKALINDIKLSMDAGFNGARLHEKVFEERFLYHADRMGYLVWGEFGDWGVDRYKNSNAHETFTSAWIAQWLEVIQRDYSHPSIIGWCPLNETNANMGDRIGNLDDITHAMYHATKLADKTRPVLDTSGYSHRVVDADIYDAHDYTQEPEKLEQNHAGLKDNKPFLNVGANKEQWSIPYGGQPYFVSEFGGIWWNPQAAKDEASWGYGQRPKNIEEFYERFESLCKVLLNNPDMFGYCYTQLTDVFQEQNGIFYFDRTNKFDLNRIRKAQQKQAAFEIK